MRLRFFFDAGSGVCLWAHDAETKERFGYAVELDDLNLPPVLRTEIAQLIADYDATIDWDDPGRTAEPDPGAISFGYEAGAPLRDRVIDLLPRLRAALGPAFKIESDYEA